MNNIVREFHVGAFGIAGALAAGAAASRAAQIDRQYALIDARIEGRARVNAAKAAKNAALRRRLAALNAISK